MNASVIASYAFIYFVLFLVVPLILVSFTMTCIRFFKSTVTDNAVDNLKMRVKKVTPRATEFINKLNRIVKGKYNVIYGTNLDNIVSVEKDSEWSHSYLKQCHLDYVLVDSESADVKVVITDPQHNTDEKNQFIDKSLAELGVKVLHLKKDQQCDDELLKGTLIAA